MSLESRIDRVLAGLAAERLMSSKSRKQPQQRGLKAPRIRLIRRLGRVRVYLVSGTAVRLMTDRNPNAPDFTMGTNWAVWPEIVPQFELWICDELGAPRPSLELKLTTLHESHETRRMTRAGLSYDAAHAEALAIEDKYRKAKGRGLDAALRREARLWS